MLQFLTAIGIVLLGGYSYGQSLEQEAYNICLMSGTHSNQCLNDSGIIKFESLQTAGITCSVNLLYNYTEISSVTFTFVDGECFSQSCPLPATIEIADRDFCPSSSSYSPPLEASGILQIKVFGDNKPPLKSFKIKYVTGSSFSFFFIFTYGYNAV